MTPWTGMPRAAIPIRETWRTTRDTANLLELTEFQVTRMSYGNLRCFSGLQIYRRPSLYRQAAVNREGQRRQRSGIEGILKALCSKKKDVGVPRRADILSFYASSIAATRGHEVEGPHSAASRRSLASRESRLEEPW